MDTNTESIYAGIAGIQIEPQSYDLGHGVVVSKTFAHLMSPFMIAFAPPKARGLPHPAPWKAVHGGMGTDFHVQLFVPNTFSPPNFFDRLNTIWSISALFRLKFCSDLCVTSITNKPFSQLPLEDASTEIHPAEFFATRFSLQVGRKEKLDESDLLWIRENWFRAGQLMCANKSFYSAFHAVDSSASIPNPALALVLIWGALEALFAKSKVELSFRTSAAIASYLEPSGLARHALHKRLVKLYGARSAAAHGADQNVWDSYTETYAIVRRVILRMIENDHVPSTDELEQALFGTL
jgi:hypothetical protein